MKILNKLYSKHVIFAVFLLVCLAALLFLYDRQTATTADTHSDTAAVQPAYSDTASNEAESQKYLPNTSMLGGQSQNTTGNRQQATPRSSATTSTGSGGGSATAGLFTDVSRIDWLSVRRQVGGNGDISTQDILTFLGLGDAHQLALVSNNRDKNENQHIRYRQLFQSIPVWGGELVVHRNRQGVFTRANGNLLTGLDGIKLSAALSNREEGLPAQTALQIARGSQQHESGWAIQNERIETVIYADSEQVVKAYVVSYFADKAGGFAVRPFFIINALNGAIIKQWEGLAFADATGPGGNQKTGRYDYGSDYSPMDVGQEGNQCTMENDNVRTINLNHGTAGGSIHTFTCPENTAKEINGAFSPLNDAHFFGKLTFDMFNDWVGVSPLSFQLVMRVHYGTNYENAFWNGSEMTFGDGNTTFYPLVDVNVSAHEVAHGFTEQNSNLIYRDQSGGINEAFSDIAGEAAEFYWKGRADWMVGADITRTQGALRYFQDPTQDGQSIGHASDYYAGIDVHYSSGVYNRAFYLLANTDGWGVRRSFEVFAHANRHYWVSDTTYNTGACGVLNAANDLRYNVVQVDNVFKTVGVDCGSLPVVDQDGDGIPDSWEIQYGLDPDDASDATGDPDNDGLGNYNEYLQNTLPNNPDTDIDGLNDGAEVNTHGTNPTQADSDSDGLNDGAEINTHTTNPLNADTDADGLNDGAEVNTHQTNPLNVDTDNDGMSDGYEIGFGFDAIANNGEGDLDADRDGLSNLQEFQRGTQPDNSDSDSDGLTDGAEVNTHNTNPAQVDTDSDALNDGDEVNTHATNPLSNDTDSDGMADGWEVTYQLDPLLDDSAGDLDSDGLSNLQEYQDGSNPRIPITRDTEPNNSLDQAQNIDGLFSLSFSENIGDTNTNTSTLIPHVSILGSGDDTYDYFSFTVAQAPSQAIFDVDNGAEFGNGGESVDTYIRVYDAAGNLVASNDDASINYGQGGSVSPLDSFLLHTFTQPGVYRVKVSRYPDSPVTQGATYDLHISNQHNVVIDLDSDTDGTPDFNDNCPDIANPDQIDSDLDGAGNACDLDDDNDGMSDAWEIEHNLDPLSAADASVDSDNDGYSNREEYEGNSDPNDSESAPLGFCQLNSVTEIPLAECQALVALYRQADGEHWASNNNWLVSDTPCGWDLVACEAGHVTGLNLFNNQLSGGIPTALQNLNRLRLLNLGSNQLSGGIPTELGALVDLTAIYLGANQLTGALPYSLMRLESLETLHFYSTSVCTPDTPLFSNWLNSIATQRGTDTLCAIVDQDSDGLPDDWERYFGLNPAVDDATDDADLDRLSNLRELQLGTLANNSDSDADGLLDAAEVDSHSTNPMVADTDADTLSDGVEVNTHATNPLLADTDSDAMSDGWEVLHRLNPLLDDSAADPDNDGVSNVQEYQNSADPNIRSIIEVEPNDSLEQAQDIDGLFTRSYSGNIGDQTSNTSTSIPHVSIAGTGDGSYDYFSFSVDSVPSRSIFDIDSGAGGSGHINTYLRVYDTAGNLVASNDDAAISNGQGGSTHLFDAFLVHDFSQTGTYTVKVSRFTDSGIRSGDNYALHISNQSSTVVDPALADATLSALAIDGVTLTPVFASDVLAYSASVLASVSSVQLIATATNPAAERSVLINDVALAAGAPVNLQAGQNTLQVIVTAVNATTRQTYTIGINRALVPAVSIVGTAIGPTNQARYSVGGSCSFNGEAVQVDIGGIAASTHCTNGAWLVSGVNLSGVPDGALACRTCRWPGNRG